MEFPIDMNDDDHERILRALTPYAARIAFLHRMIQIYRYRKTIFIFLFCSFLCLNHIYPVIHIVPPFSSKSPSNPHSNPNFIPAQTLKEQILKLSVLNFTVDSLKKSNTHILNLLNHQDLNRDQKNALKICQYMDQRSVTQLQEANREINKAIDDLDSFLDYETACERFRDHIDEYLTMADDDQRSCLQQFRHVGMIHYHHEGRSEGQNLLISLVFDLKLPAFWNLSHSLEMAKEIEKDCKEMLEKEKEASLSDFGEEEEEEEQEQEQEQEEQEEQEAIDSEL